MILQNKIDEAANLFAEQRRLDSRGYPPKVWFNAGVQFAINEIEPLICEFIEWCSDNYIREKSSIYGEDIWTDKEYRVDYKITQQLLDEFINHKNNQK